MIDRRHLCYAAAIGLASAWARAQAQPQPQPQTLSNHPPLRPNEWLKTPNFAALIENPYRVGMRPHRTGGVRLERDTAPDATGKILIHNYGHGGAGITLGWGCADRVTEIAFGALKAELRSDVHKARFAVVGAGVAGLTTAAEIKRQLPQATVSIYAKSIANGKPQLSQTTSWIAGGQFEPSGIWRQYKQTGILPDRLPELHDLLRRSHRRIVELKRKGLQRQYGIVDRKNYVLEWEDAQGFELGTPRDVIPTARVGTLPFKPLSTVVGKEFQSWIINPTILLPRLVADLAAVQARFEQADVRSRSDLLNLDADVVINCTGLGAREILKVDDLSARRGQLVILRNPDQLKYMFSGGCGQEAAYMFARQDDIVVGGTYHACENEHDLPMDSYTSVLKRIERIFAGDVSACRESFPTKPPAACNLAV